MASSDNLVRDLFKARDSRKKVAAIFPQKPSPGLDTVSQNVALGGKPQYYPAAIDLGSTSIKILQLAKTSRGFEVAKIAYTPLEGEGKTLQDWRRPLENLIKANQIKGEVVSSVPLSKVQIVNFILPNMPAKELDQAVLWKLKQNPPNRMLWENVSYDYVATVQSRDGSTGDIYVLAFVSAKDAITERVKFFKELSLELVAVDLEPYAIFSALLWQEKIRKNETVLVLDLGGRESSLTIVHGGQLYHLRMLENSGNALTQAIMNSQRCDWLKAEKAKIEEGLNILTTEPAKNESTVMTVLSGQLESMVLDIEHTFQSFVQQVKKPQISSFDKIILCGGGAGLTHLDHFLKERLEVPVEVYNPLNLIQTNTKQEFNSEILSNATRFAGVMGSASRFIEW